MLSRFTVCTTAFYKPGSLAHAMLEFRNSSFGARVNAFVKGIRVKTIHLGYIKTVKALSNLNARQYKFKHGDKDVTVEDYFLESRSIVFKSGFFLIILQNTKFAWNLQTCLSSTLVGRKRISFPQRFAISCQTSHIAGNLRTNIWHL